MRIDVGSGSVPPQSNARVRLLDISPADPKGDMPPGIAWTFKLLSGEQTGEKCYRTISAAVKPSNVGGKFIAGAYGREELPAGKSIDLDGLVGKEFIADLEIPQGGQKARVERIRPAPTEQKSQAEPAAGNADGDADIPF